MDSLGKTNLSLVDSVTIHEMNHLVYAPARWRTDLPDFLVNDVSDPDDYPDHIYLSDILHQHRQCRLTRCGGFHAFAQSHQCSTDGDGLGGLDLSAHG